MYDTKKDGGDDIVKCEVIRDLLPLYAEDECSTESSIIINEHLSNCKACTEYLQQLKQNIEINDIDEKACEEYLEERDLLSQAKKDIKRTILKKILTIVSGIIIGGNLILVIVNYISMIAGYDLEYPRIYGGKAGIIGCITLGLLALAPLIHSVASIVWIQRMNYKENFTRKIVLNSILSAILIIGSIVFNLIVSALIPPMESFTMESTNYLKVGEDMKRYEDVYCEFFPESIPKDASNIEYYYRKYNSVLSMDAVIRASWTLSNEDYERSKRTINDSAILEPINGEQYRVYVQGIAYPVGLDLIVEYDDETSTIVYLATIKA